MHGLVVPAERGAGAVAFSCLWSILGLLATERGRRHQAIAKPSRMEGHSMHPVNVVIILCIGNIVGWVVGIYVKNAMPGLIGHVVISTIGAFIAGYLTLELSPEFGAVGMIPAAFIGAGLLLYLVRFKKWGSHKKDS